MCIYLETHTTVLFSHAIYLEQLLSNHETIVRAPTPCHPLFMFTLLFLHSHSPLFTPHHFSLLHSLSLLSPHSSSLLAHPSLLTHTHHPSLLHSPITTHPSLLTHTPHSHSSLTPLTPYSYPSPLTPHSPIIPYPSLLTHTHHPHSSLTPLTPHSHPSPLTPHLLSGLKLTCLTVDGLQLLAVKTYGLREGGRGEG